MSTHRLKIATTRTTGRRGRTVAARPAATNETATEILVAIRRIIRATDMHSKRLMRTAGLTTPQVLVLQAVDALGEVTVGQISRHVSLSQATVTTIADRLEHATLIERHRSDRDRRVIHLRLTPGGRRALAKAPSLLQDDFLKRLSGLPKDKQAQLLATLQQIATMMDAQEIDAAPLLDIGEAVEPVDVE